jgi:hypothetical protein
MNHAWNAIPGFHSIADWCKSHWNGILELHSMVVGMPYNVMSLWNLWNGVLVFHSMYCR